MKKLIFTLLLLPLFAFSQGKIVSGVVNDDMGGPLPGATVQVKGSESIGSITDFDGKFTIAIRDGETRIIVSYVGFVSQEINIEGQNNISVSLEQDVSELEEVVVIGYGTVLKKDLTGSVSSVKVSETISRQSTTVDQLLQGRAAGVQVTQNAANPGSGISVRIRGTSSLRGNNEPLYVVDGIIISSASEDVVATGGNNTGQEQQNGLNGINPRDIEDIQVLKDASATAIYGSRGANGVILITTKKGTPNEVKTNFFMNTSMRSVTKTYDVLDAFDYARYRNESSLRTTATGFPAFHIENNQLYQIVNNDGNVSISDTPVTTVDWQDELLNLSTSLSVGGSVSGGSDNGNYYLSAGFNDQKGLAKNSSFKSGDIRLNLNQTLSPKIKINARLSGFFSSTDFAEGGDLIGSANQSFIRNLLSFRPILPDGLEDAENIDDLGISSPYSFIEDFEDKSNENRFFGSLTATFDLGLKGLSYQVRAGGNIRTKERRRFYGLTTFVGLNANGQLQLSNMNASSFQVVNTLRFNRTFNRKHRINSVFGLTYDQRTTKNMTYVVQDFVTLEKTTEQPFLGQVISSPLANLDRETKLFSILGRVNYAFDNKYIITASFRRDGVSKFLEDQRYGFFPSVALAWNAHREGFIKNIDAIDQLKLRVGWGQIGNHGIGAYGTLSNYGINSSVLYGTPTNGTSVPLILNNIANATLTWETTEQSNIGVDFSFADGLVTGTVDAYDKTTKDLLVSSNIAPSTGFSNLIVNRGELSNKGLEIALQVNPISTDDLDISFGGNIAFNETRIEGLSSQPLSPILIDGSYEDRRFYLGNTISRGNYFKYPANIFIEGEETALFYGFETDGIYQTGDTTVGGAQAGDVRIIDQNGDNIIDISDRTIIGNPNPDYTFGINLSVRYKSFSLSALVNGVYGNDIINGNLIQMGNAEGLFRNILSDAYHGAWRPEKPSNSYPRIGYLGNDGPEFLAISDRYVEDGSYLRLNNVTLGYDLPIKENNTIKGANIYVTGQNLLTLTNYSGYDPEITSFMWTGLISGVDWNGPPNSRNILIGLNLNF
ncbi:MAG: TonB-dependent receptor [Flavobacteriaceae bacterium]|jgi:TonB-linked SusC/RagA family outer membrane protein|nr:TonB-dependent receptor [Flavobacteriaceae bacterium]